MKEIKILTNWVLGFMTINYFLVSLSFLIVIPKTVMRKISYSNTSK